MNWFIIYLYIFLYNLFIIKTKNIYYNKIKKKKV